MNVKRFLCCFLLLTQVFSGCASQKSSTGSVQNNPFDSSLNEIELGNQIHAEIMNSFHPYTEPGVVTFVNQVGDHLAEHAKRQDLSYRFTTLYNDKIYATSAPGGFVYVTTGMLNFLENESELAAVLAHEIERIQKTDARLSKPHQYMKKVMQGGIVVAPFFWFYRGACGNGFIANQCGC